MPTTSTQTSLHSHNDNSYVDNSRRKSRYLFNGVSITDPRTCQIFHKLTITLSGKLVRRDFIHTPIHQEMCPDHFTIQRGGSKSCREKPLALLRTIPRNTNPQLDAYLGLAKMFWIAFTLGRTHAATARYACSMDPLVRERLRSQLP